MRCWCAAGASGEAHIDACVDTALGDLARSVAARAIARPFVTKLLYGVHTDRFLPKHAHLRHMDAHLPEVQASLCKWHAHGPAVLHSILTSGSLYTDLVGHDAALASWYELLAPKSFDRIIELFVEQLGRSPHALRTFVRKNNGKKLDLF
ncbi:hypothetical protein T492DRAFT_935337 [Pavlovales sp. CCMP2436]|nr:hypothetical protein T492DRAFT_935337 [Pavlovales sp. CCMP2436]